MNCREASVQISLHVGDDLPAADVPALESHLEHCALCESDYESYASARDALQLVADEYSGTTDLWGEIESQIGAGQSTGSAATSTKRAWYRHPVFASGMAAALLIAASSPFWSDAKSAGEAAVGELAESASMPAMNVGLGIPDVTPGTGPLAITPADVPTESVEFSDTVDLLESFRGRGLLQADEDPNALLAVPVSNPNRGAH